MELIFWLIIQTALSGIRVPKNGLKSKAYSIIHFGLNLQEQGEVVFQPFSSAYRQNCSLKRGNFLERF
jgi:hypothetical protein